MDVYLEARPQTFARDEYLQREQKSLLFQVAWS
jgi:hypothetical protein